MDPVFTLQWPEFVLAQELQKFFPKSKHYSILVPASRQEKGIDLALVRKKPSSKSRVALLQIKASRTYSTAPKRDSTKRVLFNTWFSRFEPSPEADFFLLFGMYAPNLSQTKSVNAKWYRHCTLLFTFAEMQRFMTSCRTVGGTRDRMFGFGFDDGEKVVQTRGDQHRAGRDFTNHLLDKRIELIRRFLV